MNEKNTRNSDSKKPNDLRKIQEFNATVDGIVKNINNHLLPMNVLEITGMGRQEIQHSNVLAWIFGQLDYEILSEFLKEVAKENGINHLYEGDKATLEKLRHYATDSDKKQDIEVIREHSLYSDGSKKGNGRIDLLIIDKNNKTLIAIENKIESGKSDNQLEKYEKAIKEKYTDIENKYFIYLTRDENKEKLKEEEKNWLKANYEIIYNIIKNKLEDSNGNVLNRDVKFLLECYNDLLIKENIVEDKDLKELCEGIWSKHRDAIEIINKYNKGNTKEISSLILEKLQELKEFEGLSSNQTTGKIFRFRLSNTKDLGLVIYCLQFDIWGIYIDIDIVWNGKENNDYTLDVEKNKSIVKEIQDEARYEK